MVTWDNNIRIPIVVQAHKSHYDIYVPDLDMTIHGTDFISATANAVLKCTAIYYYNLQHNLPFTLSVSYSEADKIALKKGKGCFATLISLSE